MSEKESNEIEVLNYLPPKNWREEPPKPFYPESMPGRRKGRVGIDDLG